MNLKELVTNFDKSLNHVMNDFSRLLENIFDSSAEKFPEKKSKAPILEEFLRSDEFSKKYNFCSSSSARRIGRERNLPYIKKNKAKLYNSYDIIREVMYFSEDMFETMICESRRNKFLSKALKELNIGDVNFIAISEKAILQ